METLEKQVLDKLGNGGINKDKLKELKDTILKSTQGKKVSVTEVAFKADVSPKFVIYCVRVGALFEYNYDEPTQMFSRKLRLVHGK